MGCCTSNNKKGSGSWAEKSKNLLDEASTRSRSPVSSNSFEDVPFREKILWTDLEVNASKGKDAVIGDGSFGTVVRAVYRVDSNSKLEVAVKVLTRSLANVRTDAEFEKICSKAMKEVDIIRKAEERMIFKDCVIRTYGVAQGKLPVELTSLFKIRRGEDGVGIVMRLEKGGSLDTLIHGGRNDGKKKKLSFSDKIDILFQIARGVAELHAVGIVHADIKPDNVLLNDSWPSSIRLADFGFATFRELKALGTTSLAKSKSFRGTPLYSAPEMLINPYKPALDGKVAKASRKTDVYAFAMLSFEVLTETELFPDIISETVLCSRVHQGR
jgi:serine/threonine protein kinase